MEIRIRRSCGAIGILLAFAGPHVPLLAQAPAGYAPDAGVTRSPFGKTAEGQPVELFTLKNAHGLELRATSYGAIITSLRVPDRHGKLDDVVLGHDNLEGYLKALDSQCRYVVTRGVRELEKWAGKDYQLVRATNAEELDRGRIRIEARREHLSPSPAAWRAGA